MREREKGRKQRSHVNKMKINKRTGDKQTNEKTQRFTGDGKTIHT